MSLNTSSHSESNSSEVKNFASNDSSHLTHEIHFLGQKIVLKASDKDPELIREVIELVSQRLADVENRARGNVPHQVALIALLDLAEEYIQAKKRTQEYQQQLDNYTQQLVNLVEVELKP